MKGSAEEKTSGAKGNHWEETVLTWGTARQMLILVSPIVRDVLQGRQRGDELVIEKERLDRNRLKLDWKERSRRYEIQDEIAGVDRQVTEARGELDRLGVALVDDTTGEVGFPTLVNDRRAFFVWRPTEETLDYWRFEDEQGRRQIPLSWTKSPEPATPSRR